MQNMQNSTQNSSKTILISIIVISLLVISVGAIVLTNKPSKPDNTMTKSSDSMMKDDKMMIKDDKMSTDKMMQKDAMIKDSMSKDVMTKDTMVKDDKMIMTKAGGYNQYSTANITKNAMGTNIIFFHASWCPSCKSSDTDIKANLSKIPDNLQILKLDYDTSTELKQKYGVTSQHTFVKIDKDGNKLAIKSGLSTLQDIINFAK